MKNTLHFVERLIFYHLKQQYRMYLNELGLIVSVIKTLITNVKKHANNLQVNWQHKLKVKQTINLLSQDIRSHLTCGRQVVLSILFCTLDRHLKVIISRILIRKSSVVSTSSRIDIILTFLMLRSLLQRKTFKFSGKYLPILLNASSNSFRSQYPLFNLSTVFSYPRGIYLGLNIFLFNVVVFI